MSINSSSYSSTPQQQTDTLATTFHRALINLSRPRRASAPGKPLSDPPEIPCDTSSPCNEATPELHATNIRLGIYAPTVPAAHAVAASAGPTANFQKVSGSCSDWIGRHLPMTCNTFYIHDFVQFRIQTFSSLGPQIRAFYEKGHSIEESARLVGVAFSTARNYLLRQRVPLRPAHAVSFVDQERRSFKSSAPPPFGFCYLDGQLVRDVREHPVLQMIISQRQLGRTPTEIANFLNSRGLRTRSDKQWTQAHLYKIIRRLRSERKQH